MLKDLTVHNAIVNPTREQETAVMKNARRS